MIITAKEFLIDNLNWLSELFPEIHIRYEIRSNINSHIVEVIPVSVFNNNEDYLKAEISIEKQFERLFPDADIVFISEDSLTKIKNAGYEVKTVFDYTGSAEILGGRVKTLHPKIFGGILATGSENDKVDMLKSDIMPIDMVIVNLYPFEKMCQSDDEKLAIENIDIGGVSLLRAAEIGRAHV